MVWDTGHAMTAGAGGAEGAASSICWRKLELKPEQIKYVGISHYHGDHIGQVGSLPKATLLIGKGDWDVLTDPKIGDGRANPANFANWISGGGKVEPVPLDKDVFGDGTVVMLNTPGHTPGHHSLLVKLQGQGLRAAQRRPRALPRELRRATACRTSTPTAPQTIASIERVKQIAANLNATVIIQHDARDVEKLPAFPAAAK